MAETQFPKNFYWGAATSAHQVEGNNYNDWSEWEIKNARIKSQDAKLRNWPDYILEKYPNPLQPENYISGKACDHYHRFREDFSMAKSLGHNAHRFSIEWSRIEPEEGKFDEREIEHYREVIKALRERGMEPLVTLWHWTNPVWFVKRGGWLHRDAVESFSRFVEFVVRSLPDVRYWIVLNEPETFARAAYVLKPVGMGRPPEEFNPFKAFLSLRKLAAAYLRAYKVIHSIAEDHAQVGFAESLVYFESYNRWPHNVILKITLDWWRNKLFVPKIIDSADFIGLNYYFHTRVWLNPFQSKWWIQCNEDKEISDFGWEVYPEGIYHVLKDLKKYNKPIYVTENGVADARDTHRGKFIKEHLRYIHKAIQDGVDVRGYFYWSLLDNFEWDKGFWPRFGLVEIDYKTQERKVRPSAWAYKKIIEANGVELL